MTILVVTTKSGVIHTALERTGGRDAGGPVGRKRSKIKKKVVISNPKSRGGMSKKGVEMAGDS